MKPWTCFSDNHLRLTPEISMKYLFTKERTLMALLSEILNNRLFSERLRQFFSTNHNKTELNEPTVSELGTSNCNL